MVSDKRRNRKPWGYQNRRWHTVYSNNNTYHVLLHSPRTKQQAVTKIDTKRATSKTGNNDVSLNRASKETVGKLNTEAAIYIC